MHARSHGATNGHHMTTAALVRRVWHPALALFLSASTAVLLFPFFTYVPLHGRMDGLLPQVLAAPCYHILTLTPALGSSWPQV